MSKSFFAWQYREANIQDKTSCDFSVSAKVSYLDVLNKNTVKIVTKDYKDCLCKDKNYLHEYFVKCDKCDGKGEYILNKHLVTCNKCKGEKVVRIHDCYLCHNEGKLLVDSELEVTLDNDKEVIYHGDGYNLNIALDIYDKDDYEIEGNDVYYLRGINYSKEDYKNKAKKKIKTCVDESYVDSAFKVKKEIVCLENKGINGGNFYFAFLNEIDKEKEERYLNVIGEEGYIDLSLIENNTVVASDYDLLGSSSLYINRDDTKVETDDCIYYLNKLDNKHFIYNNGRIIYEVKLDKEDMDNDKKTIVINDEKITFSYKKNLKETMLVLVHNKIVISSDNKKEDFYLEVVPYFDNEYKIAIKDNKSVVYAEDYKHTDYRLVETFKTDANLENPIKIDHENNLVIGNDLVLIKRV